MKQRNQKTHRAGKKNKDFRISETRIPCRTDLITFSEEDRWLAGSKIRKVSISSRKLIRTGKSRIGAKYPASRRVLQILRLHKRFSTSSYRFDRKDGPVFLCNFDSSQCPNGFNEFLFPWFCHQSTDRCHDKRKSKVRKRRKSRAQRVLLVFSSAKNGWPDPNFPVHKITDRVPGTTLMNLPRAKNRIRRTPELHATAYPLYKEPVGLTPDKPQPPPGNGQPE